ncbi:MAG TPA: tetratricopeptide repeat protein [Tepidisphaeraceae bacterium]|nr:tetratricopeptide repeat protein [Tepidisphaeraceae bacterium]
MSQSVTIEQALNLGRQHQQAGQFQKAEQIYLQILQQVPNQPDALHLLGVVAQQVGRIDMAIELISRAIAGNPKAANYYSNLAEAYRSIGRLDEAEAACRRALELNPTLAVAHGNLGAVLLDKKQLDDAEQSLRRALKIEPSLFGALSGLCGVLLSKGQVDEAIEAGRRAISITPNYAIAHNNLANALLKKGLLVDAEAASRRAVELAPNNPQMLANLANIIRLSGNLEQAIKIWERAISIDPSSDRTKWDLALGYLTLGDFSRGFQLYESRFTREEGRPYWREYLVPRWDGFDLNGKTILVYPEQGYGDVIMFARFIPALAEMGARVLIHVPDDLVDLMKRVDGVDQVFGSQAELPPFDTYLPLMSVPRVLGTSVRTIPSKVPYIQVDSSRCAKWADRIIAEQGQLKVGIIWAGRPTHPDDVRRSLPLSAFEPILRLPNIKFFSLQKGDAAGQLTHLPSDIHVTDLQSQIQDFADTAAAIANLDLLISVDTAPVHVAGAIGAKVWTLIASTPDFRWMLNREDSPWYPTMRLFRQNIGEDWSEAIARIANELHRMTDD